MITPDIIISWPRNCDYPLWRQYIRDYRANFNEIIVVFTETNQGEDYKEFVRKAMFQDHILFIDNPSYGHLEDWRNVAVHAALLHSYNAPWIFFTEQDLTIRDGFWEYVNQFEEHFDCFAVYDADRMHPCGILIRREALNKTSKEFGIVPDHSDHFALFQRDIENPDNGIRLDKIPPRFYTHMNGLSHNMSLSSQGLEIGYRPLEFAGYLKKCLKVAVPLDDRFKKLVLGYFERVGDKNQS